MCLVYNNIKGALLSRGLSRMQAIEHECFADRGAAVCLLLVRENMETAWSDVQSYCGRYS